MSTLDLSLHLYPPDSQAPLLILTFSLFYFCVTYLDKQFCRLRCHVSWNAYRLMAQHVLVAKPAGSVITIFQQTSSPSF